ncbi:MAG TPA: nucleotidyl transferase AbiEii/AbiGii toxin family protein [Candidatus Acidoferrum sp.]|nr:nucleotidyl transferase AbiEii/AbiGii toxin family protein [Candidatus Acidoferrum sp.]
MNGLEAILRAVALDLADFRLRWALVGGLAVSARTEPRFTRDVDLVIAVRGDRDAEQAVHALQGRGYRVHALVEQEAAGRLATARLVPRGEDESGVVLDILFASSGIEPEIAESAEVLEILPGLHVPVASVGHLLALKLLSRDDRTRPQDHVDLVQLLRVARPGDIVAARHAVALIHSRGFQRDRDLPRDLEQLVAGQR